MTETKWVSWANAIDMVKAEGACPYRGEARALAEWGAAGVISARARLAIINGVAETDYSISEQIWKEIDKAPHLIDRYSGEIRCELPGELVTKFHRRTTKVVAQGVEFQAERLLRLVPTAEQQVTLPAPAPAAAPVPEPAKLAAPKVRLRPETAKQRSVAEFDKFAQSNERLRGIGGDMLFQSYRTWCSNNRKSAYGRSAFFEQLARVRS
jgi:hypothetical protein